MGQNGGFPEWLTTWNCISRMMALPPGHAIFEGASTNDPDPTNFITFPVLRNHVSLNLSHTMLTCQIHTKNCETQPRDMSHDHRVGL